MAQKQCRTFSTQHICTSSHSRYELYPALASYLSHQFSPGSGGKITHFPFLTGKPTIMGPQIRHVGWRCLPKFFRKFGVSFVF